MNDPDLMDTEPEPQLPPSPEEWRSVKTELAMLKKVWCDLREMVCVSPEIDGVNATLVITLMDSLLVVKNKE